MNAFLTLFALVAAAAAVMVASSADLPPMVAAHFGANGAPNGYMSREAYVAFMTLLVVALPLLVAAAGRLSARLPSRLVNLPNKDYWLAPERRAGALARIGLLSTLYAHVLVLFLVFAHWLIVDAHGRAPVRLAEGPFFAGLGVFVAITLLWAVAFHFAFRRPVTTPRR